jgi:hypothetical protein
MCAGAGRERDAAEHGEGEESPEEKGEWEGLNASAREILCVETRGMWEWEERGSGLARGMWGMANETDEGREMEGEFELYARGGGEAGGGVVANEHI